jgi:hypothetical protein
VTNWVYSKKFLKHFEKLKLESEKIKGKANLIQLLNQRLEQQRLMLEKM